ncbi:MAG: hypothetical protein NVS3B20_27500 [Polyangiales bacterium]
MVVVIGVTGRNFAAGMSGGVAYVFDEDDGFRARCNLEMVALEAMTETDAAQVRALLEEHGERTASPKANELLDAWPTVWPTFVKVVPLEHRQVVAKPTPAESPDRAATPRLGNPESQPIAMHTLAGGSGG